MKRIFTSLTAAILTLSLFTGYRAETDTPQDPAGKNGASASVMDVLDGAMLALYENRAATLPAAVIYVFQGNGVRVESPLYGDDDVNAVLDAIAQITISGETDRTVADSDTSYIFLNADGTQAGSVSFNGAYLACGGKKYEVDGKKALAAIGFPAQSDRDALTLDSPDPALHAFLERCKTELPASIKVVRDGSEREITDPKSIREAVDALYSISLVMYALRGADAPATTLDVTFVMSDATEYKLTFYDDVFYIYTYPEPLEIWSFCTDGAEYFIKALEDAK